MKEYSLKKKDFKKDWLSTKPSSEWAWEYITGIYM